jgi:hypothetical protein
MKALELINNAWYLSGIVSRDLETSSGSQAADGLRLLNQVLANKGFSGRIIPFYETQTFNAVIGQETYFIANLVDLEVLTYVDNNLRYPMTFLNRDDYKGNSRVNDVKSLPSRYFIERAPGGANISMYYVPDKAYQFEITGKFAFAMITDVNNDIPASIETNYGEYLEYELAKRMCLLYDVEWSAQKEAHRARLYRQILEMSPPDYRMQTATMFGGPYYPNFAFASIGGKAYPI